MIGTPANKYRKKNMEKYRAYARDWVKRNPEKHRANSARSIKKQRFLVIKHYSKGKFECACCGEKEYRFLAIDHINNDGAKHRKDVKAVNITWWLVKNGYPEGFQILCSNCNFGKRVTGVCPHLEPMPRPKEEDFD